MSEDEAKNKALEILQNGKGEVPRYQPPALVDDNLSADEKIQKSKRNIEDALAIGAEALHGLAEIARQSEHPRAYEVLTAMMDRIIAGNRVVIDIENKEKSKVPLKDEGIPEGSNLIFVGTPNNIMDLLEKNKDKA